MAETKALSLSREIEDIQIKLEETERNRRSLQEEINSVLESKDDVGKSVCFMYLPLYCNNFCILLVHHLPA